MIGKNDKTKLWWNDDPAVKFRRKTYNSARWRRTREFVLNNNPFCVICASKYDKITRAVDVDHIINLTDIFLSGNFEKAFDVDNLQGLCKLCHGIKTAEDREIKTKIHKSSWTRENHEEHKIRK